MTKVSALRRIAIRNAVSDCRCRARARPQAPGVRGQAATSVSAWASAGFCCATRRIRAVLEDMQRPCPKLTAHNATMLARPNHQQEGGGDRREHEPGQEHRLRTRGVGEPAADEIAPIASRVAMTRTPGEADGEAEVLGVEQDADCRGSPLPRAFTPGEDPRVRIADEACQRCGGGGVWGSEHRPERRSRRSRAFFLHSPTVALPAGAFRTPSTGSPFVSDRCVIVPRLPVNENW